MKKKRDERKERESENGCITSYESEIDSEYEWKGSDYECEKSD